MTIMGAPQWVCVVEADEDAPMAGPNADQNGSPVSSASSSRTPTTGSPVPTINAASAMLDPHSVRSTRGCQLVIAHATSGLHATVVRKGLQVSDVRSFPCACPEQSTIAHCRLTAPISDCARSSTRTRRTCECENIDRPRPVTSCVRARCMGLSGGTIARHLSLIGDA